MNRPTIRSYEDAAMFLGQSPERGTGQRGTKVLRLTPTEIAVRYHQTDVVIYHHPVGDSLATITAGGYATDTTVRRINEYAPEGVHAEVRSFNGEDWLKVDHGSLEYEATIEESITLRR
jgi:hypothetical protein